MNASTTAALIKTNLETLQMSYGLYVDLANFFSSNRSYALGAIDDLNISQQIADEAAAIIAEREAATTTFTNSTALCGPSFKGNKKSSIPAANGTVYELGSEWGDKGATKNIGIECPTCGHKYCGCLFHGGKGVTRECGCSYACTCSCCDCCSDSSSGSGDGSSSGSGSGDSSSSGSSSSDVEIELPLTDDEIQALVPDEDEEVELTSYSPYAKYSSGLNIDISGYSIAANLAIANAIDTAFQAATLTTPNVSLLISAGTLTFVYSSNSAVYAAAIAVAVTTYFSLTILPIGTPVSGVITSVVNTASTIMSPLFTQLYQLFTNGPSDPNGDPIEDFVQIIFDCVSQYCMWTVIETQGTSAVTYPVSISFV